MVGGFGLIEIGLDCNLVGLRKLGRVEFGGFRLVGCNWLGRDLMGCDWLICDFVALPFGWVVIALGCDWILTRLSCFHLVGFGCCTNIIAIS